MRSAIFFYWSGDARGLHVVPHSFPTRGSSDLAEAEPLHPIGRHAVDALVLEGDGAFRRWHQADHGFHGRRLAGTVAAQQHDHLAATGLEREVGQDMGAAVIGVQALDPEQITRHQRSEEHTSELQSLMRISYAVF